MLENKEFLLQVLEDIKTENASNDWRGTLTFWTKC